MLHRRSPRGAMLPHPMVTSGATLSNADLRVAVDGVRRVAQEPVVAERELLAAGHEGRRLDAVSVVDHQAGAHVEAAAGREPVELRGDRSQLQVRGERNAVVVEVVVEVEEVDPDTHVRAIRRRHGAVEADPERGQVRRPRRRWSAVSRDGVKHHHQDSKSTYYGHSHQVSPMRREEEDIIAVISPP